MRWRQDPATRRAVRAIGLLAGLVAALLGAGGAAGAANLPPQGPCVSDLISQPRLAYVTDLPSPSSAAWAAAPNGSHRVRLGTGAVSATVSHDGGTVAIVTPKSGNGSSLVVIPSNGGRFRTLLTTARSGSIDQVTWSDSGWLAAVVDDRRLVVFDPARRVKRTLARAGEIEGVSFAPGDCSDRLVYGRLASGVSDAPPDLYAATVDGRHSQRLTHGGGAFPVWGPRSIAYVGQLPLSLRPAQLWLVDPDGSHARQLTHVRARPLLVPTAWSDDGTRLLAGNLGGVRTSEAWTVQVPSGRAHDLTGKVDDVRGFGLSRDGKSVLVVRGPDDHPERQSIATIPWAGGRAHVLVAHGGSPSWNR
jgi:hypothetical protein